MANNFLKLVGGVQTREKTLDSSTGAADAGRIPELNEDGKIDLTMIPAGIGQEFVEVEIGEDLDAGDLVYVAGDGKAYKAVATGLVSEAQGFVKEDYVLDEEDEEGAPLAKVYADEFNTYKTGLTVGAVYYLSPDVPGDVTTTAPSVDGQIVQRVGRAKAATILQVEIDQPILLA